MFLSRTRSEFEGFDDQGGVASTVASMRREAAWIVFILEHDGRAAGDRFADHACKFEPGVRGGEGSWGGVFAFAFFHGLRFSVFGNEAVSESRPPVLTA